MRIQLISFMTPDQHGYKDSIYVYGKAEQDGKGLGKEDGQSGEVLQEDDMLHCGPASCCPNPFRPSDHKSWDKTYGYIALGTYAWELWNSDKYGDCILINQGGRCESRIPNINHNNELWSDELLIHSGWSDSWRGSAGCITIPPKNWDNFISNFDTGDKGVLTIRGVYNG